MDTQQMIINIKRVLQEYVDTSHGGNIKRAARALGVPTNTLWSWLQPQGVKNSRVPTLVQLAPFLDLINLKIIFPWDSPQPPGSVEDESAEIIKLQAEIKKLQTEIIKRDGVIEYLSGDTSTRIKKGDCV